jgi:hypothetical protein
MIRALILPLAPKASRHNLIRSRIRRKLPTKHVQKLGWRVQDGPANTVHSMLP